MNNIKTRQNSLVTNILNSVTKKPLNAESIYQQLGENCSLLHMSFVIEQLNIAGLLDAVDGERYAATDAGKVLVLDSDTICCDLIPTNAQDVVAYME